MANRIPIDLLHRARDLRRDMTFPERRLWSRISNRQILGLKFRKQHPINPFIADFYCASLKFVIEVDGMSHDDPGYDEWRTRELEGRGYCVVRCTNDEIIEDLDAVIGRIQAYADQRFESHLKPPPNPSLEKGGEEECFIPGPNE